MAAAGAAARLAAPALAHPVVAARSRRLPPAEGEKGERKREKKGEREEEEGR